MLRLALAQFRPSKGAWAETLADAGRVLREAAALPAPPDVVVFPESAISGYFLEGGVRDVARTSTALFEELTTVHAAEGLPPVDVVVGFYETWRNRIHNLSLIHI